VNPKWIPISTRSHLVIVISTKLSGPSLWFSLWFPFILCLCCLLLKMAWFGTSCFHTSWKQFTFNLWCIGLVLSGIYLWRKVVCLLCLFITLRSPKPMVSPARLFVLLKSPWWVGAMSWFHNVSNSSGKVIEYWTKVSMKFIKKIYIKTIGEFWQKSWYFLKALNGWDSMKEIWKFEDTRCGRCWILSNFCH